MPKVLYIVDSDQEYARCITALLGALDLTIEHNLSAEAFLASFDPERAACVLIDAHLPGMSGIALLKEIRDQTSVPVVLTAALGSSALASAATDAGATDFLQKPFDSRVIEGMLGAIRQAISGGSARPTLSSVPPFTDIEPLRERFRRLTDRELELARLVALGHSSKSIATSLGLSKRTVDNHRAHILEKLQFENFLQVAHALSVLQAAS